MRIRMALRLAAAERLFFEACRRAARQVVIAAIAAFGFAGCSAEVIGSEHVRRMSHQRTVLLKRQPPPSCEYRAAGRDSAKRLGEPAPPTSDVSPELAALQAKLDYERQCYKHAEMITRARLTSLQTEVDKAMKRGAASEPR